jgi:predicted Rossmann-fold nucleotide-binding protein
MKALVCGGRDYSDVLFLNQTLYQCFKWWKLKTIITGGAKGADSLAHQWAVTMGLMTDVHYAQWDKYGKSAGYKRNMQMLMEGKPDVVIAFPGGTGTENMITIARRANVPVFIVGNGE